MKKIFTVGGYNILWDRTLYINNFLIGVMTICIIMIAVFLIRHINDGMPLIVVWVFGLLMISGIGGVVAVVFNLGSDMIVNAIFIPMFIYFVGLGMFSFRKCKSVSYKAWVGAFCIMLLLVINWSS